MRDSGAWGEGWGLHRGCGAVVRKGTAPQARLACMQVGTARR